MTVAREGEGLGMITEQEYREAKARVQDYESQQDAENIEARKATVKGWQRLLLAAVEDPSLDGLDVGNYRFRTPHRILYVPRPMDAWTDSDYSDLWPDGDDWEVLLKRIEELFPHKEEWIQHEIPWLR